MFPKAVIDSGPLFSALILNYYEADSKYGRPICNSGPNDPLLDPPAQRLFLEALNSIEEKITTSHVIGELQGLEKSRLKLYGDGCTKFWRASIDLLTQWNVDEKLVRPLDLASDEMLRSCLPRIGHVDTGLIDLALRHGCPPHGG